MPSFDQAAHVFDAIASLRRLEVPFEAVIQDGGSADSTLAEIRRAMADDPRIRLIVQADHGQADAINRAWTQLRERHRYLTWLNTDDVLHPDGVASLVDHLERSPRTVVAYGDLRVIEDDGRPMGTLRFPSRVSRFRLVNHHNLVPGIVPVIRASALMQVGMMDSGLHFAMDHDLFVRLGAVGDLRRVPVVVADYRVHDTAKTVAHKAALEAEIALVRARYRTLPRLVHETVRFGLRAAWWPTRRVYWRSVAGPPTPRQPLTSRRRSRGHDAGDASD